MASFKARIGQKRPRKRDNKSCRSVSFVMAPFQATIGLRRMKKEENKNYRSVSFPPDVQYKIPKKLPNKLKN